MFAPEEGGITWLDGAPGNDDGRPWLRAESHGRVEGKAEGGDGPSGQFAGDGAASGAVVDDEGFVVGNQLARRGGQPGLEIAILAQPHREGDAASILDRSRRSAGDSSERSAALEVGEVAPDRDA